MKIRISLVCLVMVMLMTGCKVPKDIAYFQGIENYTQEQFNAMSQEFTATIVPDDILKIIVYSWDPAAVKSYNPPAYSVSHPNATELSQSQELPSYKVNSEGYITFPVVGKVYVRGLSREQLAEKLQNEVRQYVQDAWVTVEFLNYYVTFIGEVGNPRRLQFSRDKVNLIEAVASVGDLGVQAMRKNVLVIRNFDGKSEWGIVDMTDPAIFASPYFYLRQNDIIYVEPNDAKKKNARYAQTRALGFSIASTFLSAAAIVTSLIISLSK